MKIAPVLVLDVQTDEGEVRVHPPRTAVFKLVSGFLSNEAFYECANGCPGCGGSEFDLRDGEIPDEVVDQLRWHSQLCSGLFPMKTVTKP